MYLRLYIFTEYKSIYLQFTSESKMDRRNNPRFHPRKNHRGNRIQCVGAIPQSRPTPPPPSSESQAIHPDLCKMNAFSIRTSASLRKMVTGWKKKGSFALGFTNLNMTWTELRGLWSWGREISVLNLRRTMRPSHCMSLRSHPSREVSSYRRSEFGGRETKSVRAKQWGAQVDI